MESLPDNARRVLRSPDSTERQRYQATIILMAWPYWADVQRVQAEKSWTYVR